MESHFIVYSLGGSSFKPSQKNVQRDEPQLVQEQDKSLMLKDSTTDMYWLYYFIYFQALLQITDRAALSDIDEMW